MPTNRELVDHIPDWSEKYLAGFEHRGLLFVKKYIIK